MAGPMTLKIAGNLARMLSANHSCGGSCDIDAALHFDLQVFHAPLGEARAGLPLSAYGTLEAGKNW